MSKRPLRKSVVHATLDKAAGVEAYDHTKVDSRPKLFVVGGGFAGLGACRAMCKEFQVTLIDCKEYFEYYPGICRAYVHPSEHAKLSRHYQPTCDKMKVNFVWGEAVSVNVQDKTIEVNEIQCKVNTKFKYDYLLCTNGSQYGIDLVHQKRASHGTECLWYPTFLEDGIKKSAWEGLDERFMRGRRKHLEAEYEVLKEMHKNGEQILVIGAGFVGIEFATEVKYYFPNIEVAIVESRNECVGVMPEACIKYCQNYLDKNDIKCIYGAAYKDFLSPQCKQKLEAAAHSNASESNGRERSNTGDGMDRECTVKETLDQLDELSKKWGIKPPNRVYMAVGLRAINQYLPKECLTPIKGSRGGWINANDRQEVMVGDKHADGIYAAGNCCDTKENNLPKNSFPAEMMASVACHNIRVAEARHNRKIGGCFGFCQPKKPKTTHWEFGVGLCATSLGPHDATFVAFGTEKPGSGYNVLTGCLAANAKEFVRYTKVDQAGGGCLSNLLWKLFH